MKLSLGGGGGEEDQDFEEKPFSDPWFIKPLSFLQVPQVLFGDDVYHQRINFLNYKFDEEWEESC